MEPKILLVDDREDNLLSLEAILEPGGYRFEKATSGRQALKILLREYDFALILMDVKMPELNGFETATMIYQREKLKQIPIIFITAHNYGEEYVFKGYRAGAVDYISKPINPELLRAKVSVFIELYEKNHKLQMQEQKLIAINKNLETEVNERKISEEKVQNLNIELLKNIDRLENANKELDRFAFMVSHDLQEPLRKIRVFSERLFSDYSNLIDDDGKKSLHVIQNATERMQALIKDILMFSKINSTSDSFVNTDMDSLLREVLAQFEDNIKERKANIEVSKLPNLWVKPGLMQPLFYNLLSNALKYSRKDVPPVIRIRCESVGAKSDSTSNDLSKKEYCRIYFEDNGIGFEQKYAEEIFNMFKRLHRSSQYEGTGIGLALCKKIVEEHGGFISARSTVNEGSVFIVSLPVNNWRQLNDDLALSLTKPGAN